MRSTKVSLDINHRLLESQIDLLQTMSKTIFLSQYSRVLLEGVVRLLKEVKEAPVIDESIRHASAPYQPETTLS